MSEPIRIPKEFRTYYETERAVEEVLAKVTTKAELETLRYCNNHLMWGDLKKLFNKASREFYNGTHPNLPPPKPFIKR